MAKAKHMTEKSLIDLIDQAPEPVWVTSLAVDAMYFHAARQAFKDAEESTKAVEKAELRASRHRTKFDRVNQQYEDGKIDDSTRYDKIERLAIQMEDIDYEVGAAYGPFLQHLATVHVFSAAALEAHINLRGQELLEGRVWDSFERLSLDAKWLFLPRLRDLHGFDPGAQPFQDFDQLIKFRNKLVHYKIQREPWLGSAGPPEFVGELGLSLEQTEQSLASVRSMAKELARQLGESEPRWLDAENTSYFKFKIERDR